MNAALYVRVSKGEQTTENQELELRAWAARLGAEVVGLYADTASGRRADRAGLAILLDAAHQRAFDAVLVWSLDRLSREGIGPMLRHVERLRQSGVRVLSLKEGWADTASPAWDLLLAVFAWVAKHEAERIRERIMAGLARAKASGTRSGKPIGRPMRQVDLAEVRHRRERGEGWRRIARALKVPARTLRDHLNRRMR